MEPAACGCLWLPRLGFPSFEGPACMNGLFHSARSANSTIREIVGIPSRDGHSLVCMLSVSDDPHWASAACIHVAPRMRTQHPGIILLFSFLEPHVL